MTHRPCLACGALTTGSRCQRHRQRNGSSRAWRALRATVLDAAGRRCHYCGAYAETVDHLVPVSAGGSDDLSNLVAACRRCNLAKGAR